MWTTAKRTLLAFAVSALIPASVEAAEVQHTIAFSATGVTSISTANFATNPIAGHQLTNLLFIQGTTLTSCTDTRGNTYTATPQSPVIDNSNHIYILSAVNVSTGVNAATCTFAGTSTYTALVNVESSTNPTTSVFVDDAIGAGIGTGIVTDDALVLGGQQSLILTMFESDYAGGNAATPTPASGYTCFKADGTTGYLWACLHDAVTVNETAGATTGSDAWSILAAAFKSGEVADTADNTRARLLLAGVSTRRGTPPAGGEPDTLTFTNDSTTILANPETGPTWEFQNSGSSMRNPELSVYTDLGIPQDLRQYGVTTLYANYWIGDFYTDEVIPEPFDSTFLAQIESDLATARANGLKLILGFHYACGWHDPPKAQIIAHVEQVGPIFSDYADVLAAADWGMLGPCGEYGVSQPNYNIGDPSITSCNESDGSGDCSRIRWVNDNTRDIVRAWLDNTPSDRMIMFNSDAKRMLKAYSSGVHDDPQPTGPYVPGDMGDTSMTAADAFSGSDQSRIGHENQCFLTDFTSYASRPWATGPTAYMAIDGKYVPQLYFPDTHCGAHPTDTELMTEVNAGHWDFVSQETYQNWICSPACGWGSTQSNNFILQNGYRYRLTTATAPLSATHGGSYPVTLTITNDNAGMIFNPRSIEVILRNQSGGATYVTDWAGDAKGNRTRFPARGDSDTWEITVSLASVPAGNYDLILNLPDPYPSIHDDPLYSIRLANTGTWEDATGYNVLSTAVVIH